MKEEEKGPTDGRVRRQAYKIGIKARYVSRCVAHAVFYLFVSTFFTRLRTNLCMQPTGYFENKHLLQFYIIMHTKTPLLLYHLRISVSYIDTYKRIINIVYL